MLKDDDKERPGPDNKDTGRCSHGAMCTRRHGGVPSGSGGAHGDGLPLTVEAALSDTLPTAVLLGRDVPELKDHAVRIQCDAVWTTWRTIYLSTDDGPSVARVGDMVGGIYRRCGRPGCHLRTYYGPSSGTKEA